MLGVGKALELDDPTLTVCEVVGRCVKAVVGLFKPVDLFI